MIQSMTNKGMASYQLLGDIVNSRAVDDRSRLHRDVVGALGAVNAQVSGIDGLDVTVGDEFQGRYRTLGAALDAALRIRLHLLPRVDVRIGIGYGAVENLEDTGRLQDGPGWWAREAIEGVESSAASRPAKFRTAYRGGGAGDRGKRQRRPGLSGPGDWIDAGTTRAHPASPAPR